MDLEVNSLFFNTLKSVAMDYLPGMITDSVLDAYSSVTVDQLIQETKELHFKIENELKHPQTTEEYIISELHLLQYRIAKNQLTWVLYQRHQKYKKLLKLRNSLVKERDTLKIGENGSSLYFLAFFMFSVANFFAFSQF